MPGAVAVLTAETSYSPYRLPRSDQLAISEFLFHPAQLSLVLLKLSVCIIIIFFCGITLFISFQFSMEYNQLPERMVTTSATLEHWLSGGAPSSANELSLPQPLTSSAHSQPSSTSGSPFLSASEFEDDDLELGMHQLPDMLLVPPASYNDDSASLLSDEELLSLLGPNGAQTASSANMNININMNMNLSPSFDPEHQHPEDSIAPAILVTPSANGLEKVPSLFSPSPSPRLQALNMPPSAPTSYKPPPILQINDVEITPDSLDVHDDMLDGRRRRNSTSRSRSRSRSNSVNSVSLSPTNSLTPGNSETNELGEFVCEICFKTFPRVYNLKSHMKSHTDEKPFECKHCGKPFARQHDRKRHEDLHTGLKKFRCLGLLSSGQIWGCGKRFARPDALRRHFYTESGKSCISLCILESGLGDTEENLAANVKFAMNKAAHYRENQE